jgi:hypothetical protein
LSGIGAESIELDLQVAVMHISGATNLCFVLKDKIIRKYWIAVPMVLKAGGIN